MLIACVGMHVIEDGSSKFALRKHASYRTCYQSGRVLGKNLIHTSQSLPTRKTCVVHVLLGCALVSGQFYFLCVDHDDIVTTICVRSKIHLVLTS